MSIVKFKGQSCTVLFRKYENGRIAISLEDEETGEPVLTASTNLDVDYEVPNRHTFIKDWSENQGIYDILVEAKIIEPALKKQTTGYVTALLCKVNPFIEQVEAPTKGMEYSYEYLEKFFQFLKQEYFSHDVDMIEYGNDLIGEGMFVLVVSNNVRSCATFLLTGTRRAPVYECVYTDFTND